MQLCMYLNYNQSKITYDKIKKAYLKLFVCWRMYET